MRVKRVTNGILLGDGWGVKAVVSECRLLTGVKNSWSCGDGVVVCRVSWRWVRQYTSTCNPVDSIPTSAMTR